MNEPQPQTAPATGKHTQIAFYHSGTIGTPQEKIVELARTLLPFGAERVPIVEYYNVPLPDGVLGRVTVARRENLVLVWRCIIGRRGHGPRSDCGRHRGNDAARRIAGPLASRLL